MCIYNASQGIERLQKVLIELYMYSTGRKIEDDEKIYNLLMSHNHLNMSLFINSNIMKTDAKYNKLLNDLVLFYKEIRYHNFKTNSKYNRTYFYDILCSYGGNIKNKDSVSVKELESFKYIFSALLGGYSLILYNNIRDISNTLGNYTYELEGNSKSALVFWRDENVNLYDEYLRLKNAKKEILHYLACHGRKIIKNKYKIKPLDIDESSFRFYCREIIENNSYLFFDEISYIYDDACAENKNAFKERMAFIDYIFSSDFELNEDDEW